MTLETVSFLSVCVCFLKQRIKVLLNKEQSTLKKKISCCSSDRQNITEIMTNIIKHVHTRKIEYIIQNVTFHLKSMPYPCSNTSTDKDQREDLWGQRRGPTAHRDAAGEDRCEMHCDAVNPPPRTRGRRRWPRGRVLHTHGGGGSDREGAEARARARVWHGTVARLRAADTTSAPDGRQCSGRGMHGATELLLPQTPGLTNTYLLKYSTSLSVSSMSTLSRSISLGRKTSSEKWKR